MSYDSIEHDVQMLQKLVEAQHVESLVSHPGETLLQNMLRIYEEKRVAEAIFVIDDAPAVAQIVLLLARCKLNDAASRAYVVSSGLKSSNICVRDAAVVAAELWDDIECIKLLAMHEESVAWLSSYIADVVKQRPFV